MKNDNIKNQYRINEQIRVREVRIVSDSGSIVVPTRQALDMAREQEVDLVEISPNANPPVCRLIDYSKFLYQQKKRQKELKAKQVQAAWFMQKQTKNHGIANLTHSTLSEKTEKSNFLHLLHKEI